MKTESSAFFKKYHFMTNKFYKACITALDLPIRVSSFCLAFHHSWILPKILVLHLFQRCSTHLLWTLIRVSRMMVCVTLVLVMLIYIPELSNVVAKSFNALLRPDSVEESKTRSSANNEWLILQFPIVAHSLVWLHLSFHFM